MTRFKKIIVGHYREVLLLFIALILAYTVACYLIIQRESNNIYSLDSSELSEISQPHVGIVFGGGVADDEPLPLVEDRLRTAKTLLDKGLVEKLLLSGDNRTLEYNEPLVMFNYLVEDLGVDPDKLQVDYAGRSTYETCERANKIFGLNSAFLITERTHLPRALYLCKNFGIESYGVDSAGKSSSGLQVGQRFRELLARNKAIFNVYVLGEKTILGEPIDIN